VIFVTAYHAYAADAFEVHALDYLLKPFNNQRLAQTLERARDMLSLRQHAAYAQSLRAYLDEAEQGGPAGAPAYCQQLTVRSVGQIECVQLAEVLWISSAGNYVELHTAARAILHRQPLNQLEARLDPAVFARVHRTNIVRLDQCSGLTVVGDGSYELSLRCGDTVAVSQRYVSALKDMLAW
jgi:two-component system LytT family response regulator